MATSAGTAALSERRRPDRAGWLRVRLGLLLQILSVCAFLALWSAATEYGWVSTIFLPSPRAVATEAGKLIGTGELWEAVLASSRRVFLGFALAAVVAVPLGVVMGVWWPAKAVMDPFVSLLRPLPSITWIPLSILWLGIGESQKTAIVFMGSWIYILLYTLESTKRVDPLLIRAARNLGASDIAIMREVILPGALPGILSGLKVTLAISWSCVISAEMVAAQTGLGAIIWYGKDWGNLALVLVGMVGISITVLLADVIAERIERLLLPWERHRRG
ncbi:MAG TPA: ABC transporter permease [Stellaceae bacterium]|nr:ABC transporter permease [Stellaceae bacterium]